MAELNGSVSLPTNTATAYIHTGYGYRSSSLGEGARNMAELNGTVMDYRIIIMVRHSGVAHSLWYRSYSV